MTALPIADRTITEVAAALRARDTSSRELTDACLARIERDAGRLNTSGPSAPTPRAPPPTRPTRRWRAARARTVRCSASRTP